MTIADVFGLAAMLLILTSYFMLQRELIRSTDLSYSVMNFLGAVCFIISLSLAFNLGAMLLNVSWAFISLYGIGKALKARRANGGNNL